jgi:hypothetical protein
MAKTISESKDTTEVKGTVAEAPSPVAEAPAPVAVGVQKTLRPSSLVLPMVNDRASHFYFKRVFQMLRALGQYRRA